MEKPDPVVRTQYDSLNHSLADDERLGLLDQRALEAGGGACDGGAGMGSSQESAASDVLTHKVPDKKRFKHIQILDHFFKRVYKYHQSGGFFNLLLEEGIDVYIPLFMTGLLFVATCVFDYKTMLAGDYIVSSKNESHIVSESLADGFLPLSEAMQHCHWYIAIVLLLGIVYTIYKAAFAFINLVSYRETRQFSNDAIELPDSQLSDTTWDQVMQKILKFQIRQNLCVKRMLTSLDIYQLILRHQNYMVALLFKDVIRVEFTIPFINTKVTHFTKNYEFNLNCLLFLLPNSPLAMSTKNRLRDPQIRKEVAANLKKNILVLAVVNAVLCPFVFIYQLLFCAFQNAYRLKNEPGSLFGRCWSHYGKLYLRHFNELDHELSARLNRAYKPSLRYMDSFNSYTTILLCRIVHFTAGSIFFAIMAIVAYDNDFFKVKEVITILIVLGSLYTLTQAATPDENMVFAPEVLMKRIGSHISYLPKDCMGQVHTKAARDKFSRIFQYKISYIIEEVMAAFTTPLILLFCLRYKSTEIVEFFYRFTVEVEGLDQICSFAQMTVPPQRLSQANSANRAAADPKDYDLNNHRVELSLLHFADTNPQWRPCSAGSSNFLATMMTRRGDQVNFNVDPILEDSRSLTSFSMPPGEQLPRVPNSDVRLRCTSGTVAGMDGPLERSILSNSLLSGQVSMQQSGLEGSVLPNLDHEDMQSSRIQYHNEYGMGLSSYYFREIHQLKTTEHNQQHVQQEQQPQQYQNQLIQQQQQQQQIQLRYQNPLIQQESIEPEFRPVGPSHAHYLEGCAPEGPPPLEETEAVGRVIYHGQIPEFQHSPQRYIARSPSPPLADPFRDVSSSFLDRTYNGSEVYQGIMLSPSNTSQGQQQQTYEQDQYLNIDTLVDERNEDKSPLQPSQR